VRLVFAGTPAPALPSLQALLDSGHEVVAVVTRPDARTGRGRQLAASPVAELAASAGIEVLKPAHPRDPDFLAALTALAPDACPVVAYGALVPRPVLDVPAHGWVNLHFSLLPAWRGAAPVQHAVLAGDDVTGATTFGLVTETIRPTDTSGDLLARLAVSGADLLVRTLDGIENGTLVPRPQPADGVSVAPKLNPEDALVDWTAPALRVDRLVRACTPAPGAWTTFRGERLRLGPVRPASADVDLAPGALLAGKSEVLVGTGSYPVVLGEVVPQGKKAMDAASWVRGVRPTVDDVLGA
jgi:methionyl-tRNA formyltransferase